MYASTPTWAAQQKPYQYVGLGCMEQAMSRLEVCEGAYVKIY
jgi:hypothetical protein